MLVEEVFLRPEDQLLLFRGRQVADDETLEAAGILDRSKLMLLETGGSHERKNGESRDLKKEVPTAGSAVSAVKTVVDTYAAQVGINHVSVSVSVSVFHTIQDIHVLILVSIFFFFLVIIRA